jgi:hypothetical protein
LRSPGRPAAEVNATFGPRAPAALKASDDLLKR